MKIQYTKPLFESSKKDDNLLAFGERENSCICCGKPIEHLNLYVQMNTDWLAVHESINEDNCEVYTGSESQGYFPIGKECAKKMIGYTTKLPPIIPPNCQIIHVKEYHQSNDCEHVFSYMGKPYVKGYVVIKGMAKMFCRSYNLAVKEANTTWGFKFKNVTP